MNGKTIGAAIVLVAVIGIGWYLYALPEKNEEVVRPGTNGTAAMTVVVPGTYTIEPSMSTVTWAGKKPLIPDYVDSGTIGIKEGTITAGMNTASGSFTLDMNTIHVGKTAKDGKESSLESHLKESDFFDITKFPTASFIITKVTPQADSATTFTYDVVGNLTMKDITHEISFPAKIFSSGGSLHASATFTIDRTKWDIKFGSGSFFANLGNNLIADDVALSFEIVAQSSSATTSGDSVNVTL